MQASPCTSADHARCAELACSSQQALTPLQTAPEGRDVGVGDHDGLQVEAAICHKDDGIHGTGHDWGCAAQHLACTALSIRSQCWTSLLWDITALGANRSMLKDRYC